MAGFTPPQKPRALSKWLESATSPIAAIDNEGNILFANVPFNALIENLQALHPLATEAILRPPAEAWNGTPCQRSLCLTASLNDAVNSSNSQTSPPRVLPSHQVSFVPLLSEQSTVAGCLISVHEILPHHSMQREKAESEVAPLANCPSNHWLQQLLDFRMSWPDINHLEALAGSSTAIRCVMQQVQLAVASNTPVLIRGYDLETCHDLARAIWLQRFKRDKISSAGFQLTPLAVGLMEGAMLRSMLEMAIPIRTSSTFLETTLLIEDLGSLSESARQILADWLIQHRPNQLFATQLLHRDTMHRSSDSPSSSSRLIDHYLGVLVIDLPSLQDRIEDIPLLATQFLNQRTSQHPSVSLGFTPAAIEMLTAYPWTGDVAELKAFIASISIPENRFLIEPADLPLAIRSYAGGKSQATAGSLTIDLENALLETEKMLIKQALESSRGNRAQAARRLGISRAKLLRRLQQFGWDTSPAEQTPIANANPDEISSDEFIPIDEPDNP